MDLASFEVTPTESKGEFLVEAIEAIETIEADLGSSVEVFPPLIPQLNLAEPGLLPELVEVTPKLRFNPRFDKETLRTSLKASTWDGVFATVFSNITGGVLLTGFLMELGATPFQVGILAAIPLWANLMQPIGAYFSEKGTSRSRFCFTIYSISRLLWLVLAGAVLILGWQPHSDPQILISLTLTIVLASSVLGAMGSAPWLSWMAMLVPRRLRGRYFGFRNSAANLTNLISIPLMGLFISRGFHGSLLGYGVLLILGVVMGIVSLAFQTFIVDVNPQVQRSAQPSASPSATVPLKPFQPQTWQPSNPLIFLLYFSLWMFALNFSAPFFNLYMLDNLALDLSQVTLYNSVTAAANLFMLIVWGKLADRVGNRPILLAMGLIVAVLPLLWWGIGDNRLSIWLWLPLLHFLMGGTGAAIDLCSSNLQLEVAPMQNQSAYFGSVAAVAGVMGALGTTAGGLLAQSWHHGGLLAVFAVSALLRLIALVPLAWIQERSFKLPLAMEEGKVVQPL